MSGKLLKALKLALADGLMDAGVDVIDLGMTGTEEVYFGTFHLDVSVVVLKSLPAIILLITTV